MNRLLILLKVILLSGTGMSTTLKSLTITELSTLFYCLVDGAMESSFMRFLL